MRTSAPITTPGPINVPEPISARGPISASGSTITSASSRAVGSICALAARPLVPNSDDGRSKLPKSLRVTATKAGYGCGVSSTTRLRGADSRKRGAIKQAPARVVTSSPAYFEFSRKLTSEAPAVSSGAMLRIRRSGGSPGRSFAPVKAAISPVVNSQSAMTKSRISPAASA